MSAVELLIASPRADEYAEAIRANLPLGCRLSLLYANDDFAPAHASANVVLGNPEMIADLLPHLHQLRWVQSSWAGVRPLTSGTRRDYALTGVREIFGQAMAEYVAGHLLSQELRLAARVRAQRERRWLPQPSGTLRDKRLLILGTGEIGSAIAKRLGPAFDLTVTGLNSDGRACDGFAKTIKPDGLATTLSRSDYVVNTLPATPATDGLMDADAIACLTPQAIFINVGRANVVDLAALCAALESGKLALAVLDVFPEEPVAADSGLWQVPNLIMTAHIAALTKPGDLAPQFLHNLARFIEGKPLLGRIDFDRGY